MPYRGDYVRMGYRGDPGIFGNLAKLAVGTIGGFLKGGPAGAIVGAGTGIISMRGGGHAVEPVSTAAEVAQEREAVALHQRQVRMSTDSSATQPVGGSKVGHPHGPKIGRAVAGAAVGHVRGTHLDKKTKSYLVSNRSMNWANHRALARAEHRIHSAVKHFSKYIRWVHPGRKGHAAPKFGRRKK